MATLNVQDYGATGDGSTDDTAAINNAIEDAGRGDTVLIPETSDYYLVSTDNRAAVDFTGVADDVTIMGEGEGSMLRMDNTDDGKNQWVIGGELDGSTISGLVVKQLTLDGNRSENGDKSTAGFNLYPSGSGHDIRVEDVICQNAAGTGLSMRGASKVTIRRVTSRNNGRHGFDFTGENAASPDIDARSVKAVNNDGTGLDFHHGNHIAENVYCDNNRSGTKMGAHGGSANNVTLRNANLRNARANSGFRETMPSGSTTDVRLDNVQVVGAALSGFRLGNSCTYDITEIRADSSGNSSGRANVAIREGATVNADIIRSQNAGSDAGIENTSNDQSSVREYYHYNNPDGAYNDHAGTMSVDATQEQESGSLDVPGPNDVGAYVDSTTSTPTDDTTTTTQDDPAVYTMDFSRYESGTTPSDWTPQYASTDSDWSVVAGADPVGGNQLQFDSSSNARHALSWNQVDSASEVELLGLFRVRDLSQSPTAGGRLILRGSGSAGVEDCYFVNVRDSAFGLWKYVSSSTEKLSEWGSPVDGQWYFARIQASGDQLKARVWQFDTDEPSAWDAEVTDSSLSSGWVGVGSYSEFQDSWGYLSVGVGGESAPKPNVTEATSSAVIQTLSGSVQTD